MFLLQKNPVGAVFRLIMAGGLTSVFLFFFAFNAPNALAENRLAEFKASVSELVIKRLLISERDYPAKMITRGEAVNRIVEAFNLKTAKKAFLEDCLARADECFFVFAAMSRYDDIAFDPLRLYPDVHSNFRYYEAINVASMLGLVHGYLDEENTPFKPEIVITRIQTLKILLASADLMKWKEKFELEEDFAALPFKDIDPLNPSMWWYHRYLDFALQAGIIAETDFFRPDDPITLGELAEMVDKALRYKEDSPDDTQIYA